MNILLTGGTGFIGRELCKLLREKGHRLTVLSRRPEKVKNLCGPDLQGISGFSELSSDADFDAVINLSGEGIADARWTAKRKQVLLDSRIKVTDQLVDFIQRAENKPAVLISGSAVGYYGDQGAVELTEVAGHVEGFSHALCAAWEASAREVEQYGVRLCIIRTGLVIGKNGGFLSRMLPAFRLGLGGRLGDGRQWMSWIHMQDYLRCVLFLLESSTLSGVFNGTAPEPVSNSEFTQTLAKTLSRPACFPVPAFVLKAMLGEMSELLLGGQRVIPEHLQKEGFTFEFKTLGAALRDVLTG